MQHSVLLVESHPGHYHTHMYARALKALRTKIYFTSLDGQDRTNFFAKKIGAVPTPIYSDGLACPKVDFVLLTTAPQAHRSLAEDAFKHGKHVLVEKPVAHEVEDARAMLQGAELAGVVLGCAEHYAVLPTLTRAKTLIDRGDIGVPEFVWARIGGIQSREFFASNRLNAMTGVGLDLGVHIIRALRDLLGEPTCVYASTIEERNGVEMDVQVTFLHKGDARSHLHASWKVDHGNVPFLSIQGSEGTILAYNHTPFPSGWLDFYPTLRGTLVSRKIQQLPSWQLQQLLNLRRARFHRSYSWGCEKFSYQSAIAEFLWAVSEKRQPMGAASAEAGLVDLGWLLQAREKATMSVPELLS